MLKNLKKIAQLNKAVKQNDQPTDKVKNVQKLMKQQILLAGGSFMLVLVLVFTMTAAWYTNVAKTSSMNFEAAAWGLDAENISVGESTATILPGTSGIVPLSVDNSDSSESLRVGITVSKIQDMDEELQKRIYFYVDGSKTSAYTTGSETASRVYLGASEADGYFYTILGGDSLEMSDEYANDLLLKWEWVYDLQGYYFRGTVADNSISVEEYVRPIQYALEDAVYETNMEDANYTGALVSVGNQTKGQLLATVSATDGYEGTIDEANAVAVNNMLYYPVSVDANGYGVWAYLCNYGEVISAIEYDNALAESEEVVTITASLSLTAETVSAITQTVTTEAELITALQNDSVDVVALGNDLTLASSIALSGNVDTILDMNGFALSWEGSETVDGMFTVSQGAKFTVLNGQLVKGNQGAASILNSGVVVSDGGDVTLGHVKMTGFDAALKATGMNTGYGDCVLKANNCTFETTGTAVLVQDSGSVAAGKARLFIKNSTITSTGDMGICVESNDGTSTVAQPTEAIVKDTTVTGITGGFVQLQKDAVAQLIDSTITAGTGVVAKGGSVTVTDSAITGTGASATAGAASNWTNTGDGVYVEATNGFLATVVMRGSKTIVKSTNGYGVELFGQTGYGPGRVLIYDGTYGGAIGGANWNGIGTFEIYGGAFTTSSGDAVSANITRYDS